MSDHAEESQGMTLEQYLDSRDPYRSTNLPDPWPHPLMLTNSYELQKTLLPIRDDIRTILRAHGLPEHRDLPYIAQKPHYPGGDRAVNLLCVFLLAEDDHPKLLGPAKDELAKLLSEKDISNMFVEIVNIDLCFRPSLFPLSSEHPLVVGFEAAKQKIIQVLQSKLGLRWRVLCPFNVGRVEASARPAVVILVDPKTRANWVDLGREIKSLLGNCQPQTVDVEFFPGNLDLLNGTSFAGRMGADVIPAMGSSVGIHGDSKSESGTLGGYVTLTQGDKVSKGFLTNYHVVEPSDPQSRPDQTADLDRFRSPIEVESFSLQDTQATLSDLNQMINNAEDRIKELCHSMRQLEETGGSPRNLPTNIDRYQSMVSQFRRHRQHVSEMPHPMGEVTAASGKAILGRRIMDWAFVKMHDAAIARFFQPNHMFHVSPDQQPYNHGAKMVMAPPAGMPLTEFGPLVRGDVFFKSGRTTGTTWGLCHGALACCQWDAKGLPGYHHDDQEDDLSSILTEEYVILSKKQQGSLWQYQQASFAEDGDSGSFLIDTDGNICGLLYGGTSTYCGAHGDSNFYAMAGLATDITDISQSVKLRTIRKDEYGNITSAPAELGFPEPCT